MWTYWHINYFNRHYTGELSCSCYAKFCVAKKSKLESRAHYAPEPAQGLCGQNALTSATLRIHSLMQFTYNNDDTTLVILLLNTACKKLSDEVLVWLSVCSEVQIVCIWSSWCHCHPKAPSPLASFKSRLILHFWYWLTQTVLKKRPLTGCSS